MPAATLSRDAVDILSRTMVRNNLYATPEETGAWMQTDTGKRICAMIEERRKEIAKENRRKKNRD